MARTKWTQGTVNVGLDTETYERMDAFIAKQPVPPTRTQVIRHALELFLSEQEATDV